MRLSIQRSRKYISSRKIKKVVDARHNYRGKFDLSLLISTAKVIIEFNNPIIPNSKYYSTCPRP